MFYCADELADGVLKAAHVTVACLNEHHTYLSKPRPAEKSFLKERKSKQGRKASNPTYVLILNTVARANIAIQSHFGKSGIIEKRSGRG